MPKPLPALNTVAILGPGLLGGSLALALRKHSPNTQIQIWARRESATIEVMERGLADLATTYVETACHGADLIILCTPLASMPDLAAEIVNAPVADGCVVTDVGSVKGHLVSTLETVFANSNVSFIGSHPMAGSERAGLEAAREDLFANATCILTPTLFTTDPALKRVRAFWKMLGCSLIEMSPEEHDRKVARISHLPHLAAAAVTLAALRVDPTASACAGNGFRDTTRIASGDPELWTGIVSENRAEIISAVRDARDGMSELLAMLENVDEKSLRRFLDDAKMLRDQLPEKA